MDTKQYPVTKTEAEWRKLLTPEPPVPGPSRLLKTLNRSTAAIDSLLCAARRGRTSTPVA